MKHFEILNKFEKFLALLNTNDNIVIGGTVALKLHGLHIGREVDDLDVIIFSPSFEQEKVLEMLDELSSTKYYGPTKRTLRLKSGEFELNIIKATGQKPTNLLRFGNFEINNVDEVFAAKSTYTSLRSGTKVCRVKDMEDALAMKSLNSNLVMGDTKVE